MEEQYLKLLRDVLENGEERSDRTGVGTLSVFGRQLRCHLSEGFPLLTTKKVNFKAVTGELLWFLEGSSDERRLAEITYGTRDPSQKTIWSPNAEHTSGSKFAPAYPGDLGRIYGVQWRKWNAYRYSVHPEADIMSPNDWGTAWFPERIDQVLNIIEKIKSDPTDRRMILTAWNPGELDQMALPPCHCFCQFYVNVKKKELSCQVYIRSWDLPLGGPFNIASYALLTCMIAQVTGYSPGDLVITSGDTHCYLDQIEGIKEQLSRDILPPPILLLNPSVDNIDNFTMDDIVLLGYNSHGPIKLKMAN